MDDRSQKTREALLDAAEALFCDRGFAGVGNRELVARAGVNLAAIRYHFGSKRGLYLETVRRLFCRPEVLETWSRLERRPATRQEAAATLAGFVRELATRLLMDTELGACAVFMLREAMHPSEALPDLIASFTCPHEDALTDVIAAAAPELGAAQRRLAARSIMGQIFHQHLFRPFFDGPQASAGAQHTSLGRPPREANEIEPIVEHLIRFSLKGLGVEERTVQRALESTRPALSQQDEPTST